MKAWPRAVERSAPLLVAAALLALAPLPAPACTCIAPATPPEPSAAVRAALAGSPSVFVGVVLDVDGPYPIPTGRGSYTISDRLFRMQVLASWKGAERESVTVRSDDSCGYDFEIGEVYLVYAEGAAAGDVVATNICTRTRSLAEAADDSVVLGRPTTSRTHGRAWRSYRPGPSCPVHADAEITPDHTAIVAEFQGPSAAEYRGLRARQFPYAGLQIDQPLPVTDDPQGKLFRGRSRALVCAACRRQAVDWCRRHGGRCSSE